MANSLTLRQGNVGDIDAILFEESQNSPEWVEFVNSIGLPPEQVMFELHQLHSKWTAEAEGASAATAAERGYAVGPRVGAGGGRVEYKEEDVTEAEAAAREAYIRKYGVAPTGRLIEPERVEVSRKKYIPEAATQEFISEQEARAKTEAEALDNEEARKEAALIRYAYKHGGLAAISDTPLQGFGGVAGGPIGYKPNPNHPDFGGGGWNEEKWIEDHKTSLGAGGLMVPAMRLGGAAAGALEEIARTGMEAVAVVTPKQEEQLLRDALDGKLSLTPETYDQIEKDIEERFGNVDRAMVNSGLIDAQLVALENFGTDFIDTIQILWHLVSEGLGFEDITKADQKQLKNSYWNYVATQGERGQELGRGLVSGMVGGIGFFGDPRNIPRSLAARPWLMFLMLSPILKTGLARAKMRGTVSAEHAAKIEGWLKASNAIEISVEALKRLRKGYASGQASRIGVDIAQSLGISPELSSAFLRWWNDSYADGTLNIEYWKKLAIEKPTRARLEVEQLFGDIYRRIKRGEEVGKPRYEGDVPPPAPPAAPGTPPPPPGEVIGIKPSDIVEVPTKPPVPPPESGYGPPAVEIKPPPIPRGARRAALELESDLAQEAKLTLSERAKAKEAAEYREAFEEGQIDPLTTKLREPPQGYYERGLGARPATDYPLTKGLVESGRYPELTYKNLERLDPRTGEVVESRFPGEPEFFPRPKPPREPSTASTARDLDTLKQRIRDNLKEIEDVQRAIDARTEGGVLGPEPLTEATWQAIQEAYKHIDRIEDVNRVLLQQGERLVERVRQERQVRVVEPKIKDPAKVRRAEKRRRDIEKDKPIKEGEPDPKLMRAGVPLPELLKELEPILKKLGVVYDGAWGKKDAPHMYGFTLGEKYPKPQKHSSFSVQASLIEELGIQEAFKRKYDKLIESYKEPKEFHAGLDMREFLKNLPFTGRTRTRAKPVVSLYKDLYDHILETRQARLAEAESKSLEPLPEAVRAAASNVKVLDAVVDQLNFMVQQFNQMHPDWSITFSREGLKILDQYGPQGSKQLFREPPMTDLSVGHPVQPILSYNLTMVDIVTRLQDQLMKLNAPPEVQSFWQPKGATVKSIESYRTDPATGIAPPGAQPIELRSEWFWEPPKRPHVISTGEKQTKRNIQAIAAIVEERVTHGLDPISTVEFHGGIPIEPLYKQSKEAWDAMVKKLFGDKIRPEDILEVQDLIIHDWIYGEKESITLRVQNGKLYNTNPYREMLDDLSDPTPGKIQIKDSTKLELDLQKKRDRLARLKAMDPPVSETILETERGFIESAERRLKEHMEDPSTWLHDTVGNLRLREMKKKMVDKIVDRGFMSRKEANAMMQRKAWDDAAAVAQYVTSKQWTSKIPEIFYKDPKVQGVMNEIKALIEKHYGNEGARDILKTTEPAGEIWNIVDRAVSPGEGMPPRFADRILANIFHNQSVHWLRNKTVRDLVIDRLSELDPAVPKKEWNRILNNMVEPSLTEGVFEYRLELPNGKVISTMELITDTVEKLPAEIKKDIRAEAWMQIGYEVAADIQRRQLRQGLHTESTRFFNKEGGTQITDYVRNIVRGTLLDNEMLPQSIKRFKLAQVLEELEANKDKYVKSIGYTHLDYADNLLRINKLIRTLSKYEPPEGIIRNYVGRDVTAVNRGLNSTLSWHIKTLNTARDANSMLWRITTGIKAHLTALNPSATVTNFMANVFVQSQKRGKGPLGVIADLVDSGTVYKQYLEGKLPSHLADLEPFLKEVEASGLLNTTVVEAELGSLKNPAASYWGKTWRKLTAQKTLTGLYRFGDNIFKFDQALRGIISLRNQLRHFEIGDFYVLEMTKDRKGILAKTKEGWELKTPEGTKQLSEKEYRKVVVDAASKIAQSLFFDYSEASLYAKALRTAPIVGTASPFYIWQHKAVDMPGKPGLLSAILPGGEEIAGYTNNKKVRRMQEKAALKLSARRVMSINGMRNALMDKDRDEVAKILTRVPGNLSPVLLQDITNPEFLQFNRWESVNFGEPTLKVLGIIQGLIHRAAHPNLRTEEGLRELYPILKDGGIDWELKTLPEKERKRILTVRKMVLKNEANQYWSIADVTRLAGLAGGPFVDFLEEVSTGERRLTDPTLAEIYRDFGMVMFGGAVHKVMDIAIASADPTSEWSTRRYAIADDSTDVEDFTRWAVRKITGRGWQKVDTKEKVNNYFKKVGSGLRSSISREMKIKAKKLSTLGQTSEAKMYLEKAAMIDHIIKNELAAEKKRILEIIHHTGKSGEGSKK